MADPADIEAVRTRALRLLARREHSVKELDKKLKQRLDIDESVVRGVVEELADKNLVSDARFAAAYARDSIRLKPQAKRRLVSELVERGVPARTAAAAVEIVFDEEQVTDAELATAVADQYLPRISGQPDERRWRRLGGHLQRRGFDGDLIYEICHAKLSEVPDTESY